jgi:hypothetical protein
MRPYQNRSGDAGVVAYDYGPDWIRLKFARGHTYEYTAGNVGPADLETMKRLADSGDGLTTFINQHPSVKNGYSRRIRSVTEDA